jgi:hypothetical protein
MKVLRLPFKRGALVWEPDDRGQALISAGQMFATRLTAVHMNKRRQTLDEFDFGSGLVTTAGVNYLAADFYNGAAHVSAFTWHATGIGTTGPVIANTTMENVTGCPARVSGTPTQPGSVNIYQNVATVSYASGLAITEWGLLSAVSSGTLWDRKTFAAINVVNGDSIQFTYQLTCTAGG